MLTAAPVEGTTARHRGLPRFSHRAARERGDAWASLTRGPNRAVRARRAHRQYRRGRSFFSSGKKRSETSITLLEPGDYMWPGLQIPRPSPERMCACCAIVLGLITVFSNQPISRCVDGASSGSMYQTNLLYVIATHIHIIATCWL